MQSADPDSSASRTKVESVLMPSLPNYVRFLTGPTAAEHWKKARAVTPELGAPKHACRGFATHAAARHLQQRYFVP